MSKYLKKKFTKSQNVSKSIKFIINSGGKGCGLPGPVQKILKFFPYIYNTFLYREPKNCKNAICQSVKAVKVGARGESGAGRTWTKNLLNFPYNFILQHAAVKKCV